MLPCSASGGEPRSARNSPYPRRETVRTNHTPRSAFPVLLMSKALLGFGERDLFVFVMVFAREAKKISPGIYHGLISSAESKLSLRRCLLRGGRGGGGDGPVGIAYLEA